MKKTELSEHDEFVLEQIEEYWKESRDEVVYDD